MTPQRMRGQLDALQGKPAYYGCHFGMRSTLVRDREEYLAGWHEVDYWLTHGNGAIPVPNGEQDE